MPTRRKLLLDGLRLTAAPAALLAFPMLGCLHDAHGSAAPSLPAADRITGDASLRAHAARHGLFVGSAVNVKVLNADAAYRELLAEQFNMVVAESEMKWSALRPSPAEFSFTLADTLVDFARKHKMKVRGHNFVWHEALPAWFDGAVTKGNARQFLIDHIMTVGGRYKGKIHSWDVVNEAIWPKDGRSDGLRNSVWMQLLGPEYIDLAFRTARRADPHALLTYNEYGVEYDDDDSDVRRGVTLQLLRRLRADGVPLDAVGIQSHIQAASPHTIGKGLREFMASIRQMGLQIYITELDVNEDDIRDDDIAHRDEIVAATYRDYLNVVLAEPAVKAVLTWGTTDKHTWLNNTAAHKKKQLSRPQRALPFDRDYRPKKAFVAMRDGLDKRV